MDDVDRIQQTGKSEKNCCKQVFRTNGQLRCHLGYEYLRSKCFYGNGSCEEWTKR